MVYWDFLPLKLSVPGHMYKITRVEVQGQINRIPGNSMNDNYKDILLSLASMRIDSFGC